MQIIRTGLPSCHLPPDPSLCILPFLKCFKELFFALSQPAVYFVASKSVNQDQPEVA